MAIAEQLRTVARLEYALVRSALTTVDRTILTPLADRSPGVERVVSRARDAFADLDDRLDEHFGGAGQSPSAEPVRKTARDAVDGLSDVIEKPVEKVEKSVEKTVDKVEDTVEDTVEDATTPEPEEGSAVLTEPEVHEAQELAEELLETEADHLTGELAENEDLREVQARLRAKHALQEQDEQHR